MKWDWVKWGDLNGEEQMCKSRIGSRSQQWEFGISDNSSVGKGTPALGLGCIPLLCCRRWGSPCLCVFCINYLLPSAFLYMEINNICLTMRSELYYLAWVSIWLWVICSSRSSFGHYTEECLITQALHHKPFVPLWMISPWDKGCKVH